jgi:hypothetical protein
VPEIKKKVDERNAAKLDAESYRRRLEDMKTKTPTNPKLSSLKQKFEIADARFNALNSSIKVFHTFICIDIYVELLVVVVFCHSHCLESQRSPQKHGFLFLCFVNNEK